MGGFAHFVTKLARFVVNHGRQTDRKTDGWINARIYGYIWRPHSRISRFLLKQLVLKSLNCLQCRCTFLQTDELVDRRTDRYFDKQKFRQIQFRTLFYNIFLLEFINILRIVMIEKIYFIISQRVDGRTDEWTDKMMDGCVWQRTAYRGPVL